MFNGNSTWSNGNSFLVDEQQVATLPVLFRVQVAGWGFRP